MQAMRARAEMGQAADALLPPVEPALPSSPSSTMGRQGSDPSSKMRRAWTPEKNARAKRPVLGPMLWSENELAAFLYCMGIDVKSARSIQRCSLKGVYQF